MITLTRQIKTSLNLAVECIISERHKLAPEALGFKSGMFDSPYAKRAAKRYDRLTQAIIDIENLEKEN